MPVAQLPPAVLEQLCSVMADTNTGLTGTEIGRLLHQCGIDDVEPANTKRHRLFSALSRRQEQDRCANNIIAFLKASYGPVRFTGSPVAFEAKRTEINQVLSFVGLEFTESGECREVPKVSSLRESALRANRLKRQLEERAVHHEVLAFCREELLVENFFHAVLEATKSVAEKVRQRTGLTADGGELIDEAFAFKGRIPHLALSSLTTESEQSEQKGFMNLLKGLFGTFRNPVAHAPKITWAVSEQDALDILSLVSLAHRRIDAAVQAHKMSTTATGS